MTAPEAEMVIDARPWPERHRRVLVIGSRTAVLMLFIAGLAILGLGVLSFFLTDPPEVDGWLRSVFGTVFAVAALGIGVVIGIPAAVGLSAMSGASHPDAPQALSPEVRRVVVAIAITTVVITAVVCLTSGTAFRILNLGLVGLVGLASFGLAGAAAFSPHRVRAALSGVAVLLLAAATLWVLATAFLGTAD